MWNFYFGVFLVSSMICLFILAGQETTTTLWVNMPSYPLAFCFDKISMVFFFMTTFVSFMVFLYSLDYMSETKGKKGFITILLTFSLSMLLLSTSGSLLSAMIGWDGLGVTSFCLIIFFQNWKSFNSSMITFISNRIGDVALLGSISILLSEGEGFFWSKVSSLDYVCLLIFVACMTKSAQLPFSQWLPRAMAAPTPVSALVHSSTLVTAGVFLYVRFLNLFPEWVVSISGWVSILTILHAGSSSLGEFDLKKIIALSTLSHISLMFFMIFLGSVEAALVHMVVHAIFKSTLFMVAGTLIHGSGGDQDIRRLSILNSDPSVEITLLVSCLSMAGAPFFSGFFSKELMLHLSFQGFFWSFVFFISALLTCGYTIRIVRFLIKFPTSPVFLSGKSVGLFFHCSLSSVIFAGVIISYLDFPVSSVWMESKVMLYVAMMVGCLLGLSSQSFYKVSRSISKFSFSLWMSDGVAEALNVFVRTNSWLGYYFSDTKGHLDLALLSSGVTSWSMKYWFRLFQPSPLTFGKILILSLSSAIILM